MTLWTLEPRDTLVLRDGRPMVGAGLQIDSLTLPRPATVAGFLRTRSASDAEGRFLHAGDNVACARLLESEIAGPWLAATAANGTLEHLLPAPRDAVGLECGDLAQVQLARLGWNNRALRAGELSDQPEGTEPLFLSARLEAKPRSTPAFWNWSFLSRWLEDADSACGEHDVQALGHSAGALEQRTHVSIDPQSGHAAEGMLFSLGHRRFVSLEHEHQLSSATRLRIVVECDLEGLAEGVFPFAGERRLVHLRRCNAPRPAAPEAIVNSIVRQRRARLLLVTPALFEEGWKPTWLLNRIAGLEVHLRAAVLDRPISISGWDFARRCPKPAKRAVPAGAVYFLEFDGDESAIRSFIERLWWRTVSDDEQARRDGFGLAVFGSDCPLGCEDEA